MATFISQSLCRGHRPQCLAARKHFPRPDLVAGMLRERAVARFLVAPSGFGKTGVAFEYADTVFAFQDVFWINCKSPCFFRDLDAEAIFPEVVRVDKEARLVVFEDVPLLESQRACKFSKTVDDLLERGCEVVATCTPGCDVFASLQKDRVRLSAFDLLLTPAEISSRTASVGMDVLAEQARIVDRIPGLAWADAESAQQGFLNDMMREELPGDYKLAIVSMLVLRQDRLDALGRVASFGDDVVSQLACDYPYLGIDSVEGTFFAPGFDIFALARAAKRQGDVLVAASNTKTMDRLSLVWADQLVDAGAPRRACQTVQAFCSKRAALRWIRGRFWLFARQGCLLPLYDLLDSLVASAGPDARLLDAECSICLMLLGDKQQATSRAKRVAFDATVSLEARTYALLVIASCDAEYLSDRASDALAQLAYDAVGKAKAKGPQQGYADGSKTWLPLLEGRIALSREIGFAAEYWQKMRVWKASDDALCIVAAWVFEELSSAKEPPADARGNLLDRRMFSDMAQFAKRKLRSAKGRPSNLFACMAANAMERACDMDPTLPPSPLSAEDLSVMRHVQVLVMSQQRTYNRVRLNQRDKRLDALGTHPDSYLTDADVQDKQAESVPPTLTVRLFGRMEVMKGGMVVPDSKLHRQKARLLMAILAANAGKEVSINRLTSTLWPTSNPKTAKKNLYTVWSELRAALALSDGTCPYLIRHLNGCCMNERLVSCDVQELDSLCRDLTFGSIDGTDWATVYLRLNRDFADDLMPAETENDFIVRMRDDYRTRLVDALVQASGRLAQAGSPQTGLWFAREALRHDTTREDAYKALALAQKSAGQRTAAISTCLRCRKELSSQLGIDPSPEIEQIYQELLTTGQAS